ncbi:MAG TPA: PaaI family thioesterase [Mycobacterium sp.]|nr:PaaI family thioesterase [Mycobacterium sp.]
MSPAFEPGDLDYEQRVRETFARQGLMATFAAELRSIEPGVVEIEVPFSPELSQQDDFFHAGVGIAILDSACGCAAFTLMAPGTRVLTVELKVNLLAPRSVTSCERVARSSGPAGISPSAEAMPMPSPAAIRST